MGPASPCARSTAVCRARWSGGSAAAASSRRPGLGTGSVDEIRGALRGVVHAAPEQGLLTGHGR